MVCYVMLRYSMLRYDKVYYGKVYYGKVCYEMANVHSLVTGYKNTRGLVEGVDGVDGCATMGGI